MRFAAQPQFPFLAATSLTNLKPRLKRMLRPMSTWLWCRGVTANQVTTTSLLGSLSIGVLIGFFANHPIVFALLLPWSAIRMCLATIDGTLAIDFGQKSRLGGVLNEVGDISSDIALVAPLGLIVAHPSTSVGILLALIVLSELAGISGPMLGGSRQIDGPFGKADRSLLLGLAGIWIACTGQLPAPTEPLFALCDVLAILTIGNRLRFALAGY